MQIAHANDTGRSPVFYMGAILFAQYTIQKEVSNSFFGVSLLMLHM